MRTEDVSPRYADLDLWSPADLAATLVEAQLGAVAAVRSAQTALAAAVEDAVDRLRQGSGRLVYAGAGASARLAVQDGVELFPTYGWPHERLIYLVAGGDAALIQSIEGAEDDTAAAEAAVTSHGIGVSDVVVCVAASGGTPYTIAVAKTAWTRGALTVGLANNRESGLLAAVDHPILLETGAEVVAGSTRMAAGTAQKAALNVFSTAVMVRLKRVYANLMVDLSSSNLKLDQRRIAMVQRITGAADAAAADALAAAGGHVKTAVLIVQGVDAEAARDLLSRHGGDLRAALAGANDRAVPSGHR